MRCPLECGVYLAAAVQGGPVWKVHCTALRSVPAGGLRTEIGQGVEEQVHEGENGETDSNSPEVLSFEFSNESMSEPEICTDAEVAVEEEEALGTEQSLAVGKGL